MSYFDEIIEIIIARKDSVKVSWLIPACSHSYGEGKR